MFGKSPLRCGCEAGVTAIASKAAGIDFRFAVFGAALGRSVASIFFAAAMRCGSEPALGIFGTLFAGFALFFAAGFFAAAFLATVFLVGLIFPALELRRALPDEGAFFIVAGILHIRFENVKPIMK